MRRYGRNNNSLFKNTKVLIEKENERINNSKFEEIYFSNNVYDSLFGGDIDVIQRED